MKKFNNVCPQAKLDSGYGLTETAALNFLPPLDNVKFGSVGKPVPWIEVKIVDQDGVEVNGIIHKHPKVKEVGVVGVPDKLKGEAIKAVIVPKEGEEITEKEIIDFCKKHLASYKVPKIVEFRKELPKIGSGKIKKELLR
ncbi:MAG: AMP-binding protein [Candidatus Omnitrophica bacterium]|nr:AMP-binding protein [Candidatus Omnitrophota bacterium]